jgi:hypothetical protein
MKSVRKPGFDRVIDERRSETGAGRGRDRVDERKERLVVLIIALLFIANVVVYLCHHYGLTSLNERRSGVEMSARG